MNLSLSSIFASLLFSSIGLWLIKAGRSRANITLAIIGVVLLLYTYFTSSPWVDWGLGSLLCFAAYYVWDR